MDLFLLDCFRSSVLEAVLETLALNKPLLVFLSRRDADSTAFISSCLSTDLVVRNDIMSFLESEFVLLRLFHGTIEYGFFEEIFSNLTVPSVCIVRRQSLVDVIQGDISAEEFDSRIRAAVADNSGTPTMGDTTSPDNVLLGRSTEDRSPEILDPAVMGTPQSNLTPEEETSSPSPPLENGEVLKAETKVTVGAGSSHEESVRKHKLEIRAKKRQQAEEKLRLRILLESDRKEVALRFQALQNSAQVRQSSTESHGDQHSEDKNVCTLLIKFFDGSSVRWDFESGQTLADVRKWLDSESGVEIIPSTELLPLFASSPYLQPIQYVFHLPDLPRITYTSDDELKTLADLGLCPRSALILKPIYENADSANVDVERLHRGPGLLSNLRHGISIVGGALYSFFDYGANQDHINSFSDDEGNQDVDLDALAPTRSSNHDASGRSLILGAAAPSLLLIQPHVSAGQSLINIEDSFSSETMRPSRPSTPRNSSQAGSIKRTGLKFGEVVLDRSEKDTETYNGNTVNLDQRKDEDQG